MPSSQLPRLSDMPEYPVSEAQPMRLHDVRGRRIDCLSGLLWISISDVAEDFYVAAGESFIVPAQGLVLVGPLSARPARLRIEPPLSLSLLRGVLRIFGMRSRRPCPQLLKTR